MLMREWGFPPGRFRKDMTRLLNYMAEEAGLTNLHWVRCCLWGGGNGAVFFCFPLASRCGPGQIEDQTAAKSTTRGWYFLFNPGPHHPHVPLHICFALYTPMFV